VAGEVYQALKTTDFDERRAIGKLNADRLRKNKQPTNNAASEILHSFCGPEQAEEKPRNHTKEDHGQPKRRIAPSSKRASPIPDPQAENQTPKRPRRNAPQKPMANNSRATAILIHDEEDEISGSSQQLPPVPREASSGLDSPPHLPARPSSLDSVTDPTESEVMDVDSLLHKRPVPFTNSSSPAKIRPSLPTVRPPPRATQTSIRNYILPMSPQRRGIDPARIVPMIQGLASHPHNDVRGIRHRTPTPGPLYCECKGSPSSGNTSAPASPPPGERESASATVTTMSSEEEEEDEEEEAGPLQIDPSVATLPKKVGYEVFNDDTYLPSSPLPHKKTAQGNLEVEILPKRSASPALLPSLRRQEARGGKALPAPPPLSPLERKRKEPIGGAVQGVDGPSKPKAGGQALREIREEIPSSQPSPPPISRHATPELELVKEEEVQDVIEVHEMREARHKRGKAREARQTSSELSEPQSIPSSPDRPKKKQDVEVVGDDDDIEEKSPPPVVKKSSKPKRPPPRGRGVAVTKKKKTLGSGERGKMWITVDQDEEGGEQEIIVRERRRRLWRG